MAKKRISWAIPRLHHLQMGLVKGICVGGSAATGDGFPSDSACQLGGTATDCRSGTSGAEWTPLCGPGNSDTSIDSWCAGGGSNPGFFNGTCNSGTSVGATACNLGGSLV